MLLLQQQQVVNRLAALAEQRAHDAARARGILASWTRSYFGSVSGLAWSFAVGAWWAAGRFPLKGQSGTTRKLVNLVNTAWLGWQVVHRQANRLSKLGSDTAE